ncbi:MAG: Gfo/Idh/MocA family oxidoreductase, partial [Roseomonas sp.]|nr:Gfo/Idh/MocA family oxidoreductase [Roseomonas sp.]
MAERRIGIIMNGVTGRMGMNQHLIRSIAAIRAEGGLPLADGDRLMPDPVIVGRNRGKLDALAKAHRIERVSTDLDACLADGKDEIFFDAATTQLRAGLIRKAIDAGKHIYCEKPTADNLADALDIARLARQAGIKHGVVQDKLFLPGLRKLKMVIESGQLGRLLSIRGEFGYWVFEGDLQPTQ